MNIGRVLTAMVTPFSSDGAVDYGRARRLAQALVDSGSDGVVVAGTTGEAPTLSVAEKIRLWTEIKEALGDRASVLAGSGDNCTADSVELSREAARTGVDGAGTRRRADGGSGAVASKDAAADRCAVLRDESDPREVRAEPARLRRRAAAAADVRAGRSIGGADHVGGAAASGGVADAG